MSKARWQGVTFRKVMKALQLASEGEDVLFISHSFFHLQHACNIAEGAVYHIKDKDWKFRKLRICNGTITFIVRPQALLNKNDRLLQPGFNPKIIRDNR